MFSAKIENSDYRQKIKKDKKQNKKPKFEGKEIEEQMQVLSVCYLLLEKMMKAQAEKVRELFYGINDKSALFNKFRVSTISKCLKNAGKIPIDKVNKLFLLYLYILII
jgi:hypothetical protein